MLSISGLRIRGKALSRLLLFRPYRLGQWCLRLKQLPQHRQGLKMAAQALLLVTIKWPASARHRPHFDLRCTPRKSQSRASRTPRLGRAALIRPRLQTRRGFRLNCKLIALIGSCTDEATAALRWRRCVARSRSLLPIISSPRPRPKRHGLFRNCFARAKARRTVLRAIAQRPSCTI